MKIIATLAFVSAISASQLVTKPTENIRKDEHVYTMESKDGSLKDQVFLSPDQAGINRLAEKTLPNGAHVHLEYSSRVFNTDGIDKKVLKIMTAGLDPNFAKKILEAEQGRSLLNDVMETEPKEN